MKERSPSGGDLANRRYYDAFARGYERERGHGYHKMLDDLEIDLIERYGRGREVLEAGCGTGLLLERVERFASRAVGFDLSAGMLARARDRGLQTVQASITALPFPDARFDLVYSMKVLPHIPDIQAALAEMARVTRPGGHVIAEFYNPRSLRGLVKRIKSASAVADTATDHDVYTRYDLPHEAEGHLPSTLRFVTARGVRIVTPVARAHSVPVLGRLLRAAECALADQPVLRNYAGYYALVAQRV